MRTKLIITANGPDKKGIVSEITSIINHYNCIQDTVKRANHFANIAKDSLGIFNNTEFKSRLLNLTDSSLTRYH